MENRQAEKSKNNREKEDKLERPKNGKYPFLKKKEKLFNPKKMDKRDFSLL
ncbi:hypothetical protein [Lyngbya sp. PCC 8106]|uniref:hypothetical protein n=1 Tax=Lyngbya sp. (strain PCC 8106) TaxID=313612 RepID=UPI0000EAD551|nr:hypothetical protein [Lyngbya sp. PCC 8106]EAW37618.1 NADH dehydrogenase subunit L [Lyngbya sp. PCC 8106]